MSFAIGDHAVGLGHPVFVIAEIGVNHNGRVDLALEMVSAAAQAGAQAVKLQTFSADRLASPSAQKASYQRRDEADDQSQHAMLAALELSREQHEIIRDDAQARGLVFLSTPFDEDSADMLEALRVPAMKLGSGDLTHLPLLRHVARKGLPMIVSTGMSTLAEVERAVRAIEEAGDPPLALLHCVSNYPAAAEDANLKAMATLRSTFGLEIGWSDHTLDPAVGWAAVAMGATIVEKHLTLDRSLPGPDHAASLDPEQFSAYVAGIRAVEKAMGDGIKRPRPSEAGIAAVARRSVVALRDIRAGEAFGPDAIGARRPAGGLEPDRIGDILGRRATRDLAAGSLLSMTDVAEV